MALYLAREYDMRRVTTGKRSEAQGNDVVLRRVDVEDGRHKVVHQALMSGIVGWNGRAVAIAPMAYTRHYSSLLRWLTT